MGNKLVLLTMVFALLFGAVAAPTALMADSDVLNPQVTGSVDLPDGSTGSFKGHFKINSFEVDGETVYAVGRLKGQIRDANGKLYDVIKGQGEEIRMPLDLNSISVSGASAAGFALQQVSCDILHLELGPLDLDLLGLVVHLDKIVLDIDAEPAGGLLGSLLCGIANLLDGGLLGELTQLVDLLNQIIDILG